MLCKDLNNVHGLEPRKGRTREKKSIVFEKALELCNELLETVIFQLLKQKDLIMNLKNGFLKFIIMMVGMKKVIYQSCHD